MPRQTNHRPKRLPVITLISDFGLADPYLAEMKLAILRQCANVRLVDVTHGVDPHDLQAASIALERAVAAAWAGVVHLAVVDPGVGSPRRILVAAVAGQSIVCPDNGLLTWTWRRHGRGKVSAIARLPRVISATFHGRDVMAPIAADLAAGRKPRISLRAINDPVLLDLELARMTAAGLVSGQVIHVDHFGNATTNISAEMIVGNVSVRAGRHSLGQVRRTYSDAAIGHPIAIIGSSGLLEIAVREGSAARKLGLRVGSVVSADRWRRS
jgi:S-adenosyl-L-methionine hydrolase (adenosine-forming)